MPTTLGIYFTQQNCHAVFSQPHRNHYSIINATETPLDTDTSKQTTLKKIKNQFKQPKRTVLGLPHQQTLIQTISVDLQLTDPEIMQFLNHQSHTSFLDYEVLSHQEKTKTLRVISATPTVIDAQKNLIQAAGLALDIIDIDILSLMRLSQYTKQLLPSNTAAHAIQYINQYNKNIGFYVALGLSLWGCDQ